MLPGTELDSYDAVIPPGTKNKYGECSCVSVIVGGSGADTGVCEDEMAGDRRLRGYQMLGEAIR